MNQFNNLPPEIIEIIINKLNFNDLINLRIVDKRFEEICEQIKIRQLYLTNKKISNIYYDRFWFYTNDPTFMNEDNLIRTSKFLNYKSIFRFDKYLKRLSIHLNRDFNISILNEFKLLEQLCMTSDQLNDNYKLNLDHLKIFCIQIEWNSNYKLTLNTNELFAFRSFYTSLNQFVFNYADKILFYETEYLNDDKIKEFINLEYLKLNSSIFSIDRDILSKFKNLKILDLTVRKIAEQIKYDNLVEMIILTLDEKRNLTRSEFNIYLNGTKLINQNQINLFKWSADRDKFKYNLLEFQIKNYDLLKDNCCYMDEINYCDLIKLIKIIPSSFRIKFPHIHQVKANNLIDNEEQFIKFLSSLTFLSELELEDCELTELFYDQLIDSVYLNDLERLKIKEKKDLDLNFDFILNFKQLRQFETNQIIYNYIDLINKLYKKYEKFELFLKFKFDTKNYIEINNYDNQLKIYSYYFDDYLKRIENFSFFVSNVSDLILELEDKILKLLISNE